MIRGSTLLAETRRADPYAGRSSIEPDLALVAQRIRDEATDDWDDTVAADRFTGKGGRLVRGSARLDGPGRVVVGDDTFVAARGVVVATGSAPVVPPIDGLARHPLLDQPRGDLGRAPRPSRWSCSAAARSASSWPRCSPRYGSAVTVVEAMDGLLPPEEPEAGEVVAAALREDGVDGAHRRQGGARRPRGRRRRRRRAARGRHDGARRRAARQRRAAGPGRRDRPRHGRARPAGAGARGRRADARGRAAVGGRRRDRRRRVHAHGDVPGGHRDRRHPRPGRAGRRLPRAGPGDVHRPGGRLGRPHRAGGARAGPDGADRDRAGVELGPRLDPRPGQRRLHQAGRGRRRAACWSARPRSGRGAARCSRCSPSRCTPGCRSRPCAR